MMNNKPNRVRVPQSQNKVGECGHYEVNKLTRRFFEIVEVVDYESGKRKYVTYEESEDKALKTAEILLKTYYSGYDIGYERGHKNGYEEGIFEAK